MKNFALLFVFMLCTTIGFSQQNLSVSFQHDGKTVYGTLSIPAGTGKFPVVILTPGSGPNDRNGTFPMTGDNIACLYPGLLNDTLRPYQQLAEALTDSGYAVLRYDKLEYTYTNLGTISFHKLWLPVESALNFIKTRPEIDTNRIILAGHSEGSTLIPFIAKNRSDIKALISIGGPSTPLDTLMAWQIVNIAQSCGGNVPLAQLQAAQILSYFELVRTQGWTSSTPALFGVSPDVWYDYVQACDPVADHYNQCSLPVLFIGMGEDINVPPSELIRFQNEITIPADFMSLAGLNHYMTTATDPEISVVLTDTLIWWLRQQQLAAALQEIPFNADSEIQVEFPDNNRIQLKFASAQSGKVSIYNALGQVLAEASFQNQNQISMQVNALSGGLFFVGLETCSQRTYRKWMKTNRNNP